MELRYENVLPTPVENTKVEKIFTKDRHTGFKLTPDSGYVLHDGGSDITTPEGEYRPFFCRGYTTVKYDYDFDNVIEDSFKYADENNNEIIMPVKKTGKFEFYSISEKFVPKEQVY